MGHKPISEKPIVHPIVEKRKEKIGAIVDFRVYIPSQETQEIPQEKVKLPLIYSSAPQLSVAAEEPEEIISPEQELPMQVTNTYKPIPWQVEICQILMPPKEDMDSPKRPYVGPGFVLTQGYRLKHALNKHILEPIIHKYVKNHPVIATRFFRNDKIIDADLECEMLQDNPPLLEIQELYLPENHKLDVESVMINAQAWSSNVNLDKPFGVLVMQSAATVDDAFIVFAAHCTVADAISLTWLSTEILKAYDLLSTRHEHSGDSFVKLEQSLLVLAHNPEQEPFHEVAFEYRLSKQDLGFWRDQFVEVTRETVDMDEQKNLETELSRLNKEKSGLSRALESLVKRKNALEKDLAVLRKQRQEIDQSGNQMDKPSYFMDPFTNETIEIPAGAKKALIRAVLGDAAANDNIVALLEKHEVSKEVQLRIKAEKMNLEQFSGITEASVEQIGLMSKDKRKVLALADYVRNRIKECVHEQSKVKFTLERKIAKTNRDYNAAVEAIKNAQNTLEGNDDLSIRLKHILNPPTIEKITDPISLKAVYDERGIRLSAISSQKYSFIRFKIDEETYDNLRRFRSNWAANIHNKRKSSISMNDTSDIDSLFGSDTSAENSDTEEGRQQKKELKSINSKTVNVVCLAAFSVLLRHITGMEKFLIGITHNFRGSGQIVGPYQDSLPSKVDLSQKGITFDVLFAHLFKVFNHAKRHGKGCPSGHIASALDVSTDIPVRFEYYTNAERLEWQTLGLTIDDLFHEADDQKPIGSLGAERLWSHNEQDEYDLKLILVENGATIEAGIRYRKDKFEEEKIFKWITKYYQTVYQSQSSLGSMGNLTSSMSIYESISKSLQHLI
ncbi:hypothetical protein EDD86DRAFT_244598 [Gorgonomyces haynaldii]|nr:hypothetical protein EDD86DRAFT_244598 [Gorgonomyces haynaldii]